MLPFDYDAQLKTLTQIREDLGRLREDLARIHAALQGIDSIDLSGSQRADAPRD